MQRLTGVAWSLDNKYVLSGSDEMCIRLWKARASERIGIMRDRERVALQYNEKLKEKYGQHPQIARLVLLPPPTSSNLSLQDCQTQTSAQTCQIQPGRDPIYQGRQSGRLYNWRLTCVSQESNKRKEANRRKHSKPGSVPHLPEREAHTIQEME